MARFRSRPHILLCRSLQRKKLRDIFVRSATKTGIFVALHLQRS